MTVGASSTAGMSASWGYKDMPSQKGKTFLVTGANAGVALCVHTMHTMLLTMLTLDFNTMLLLNVEKVIMSFAA